MLWHSHFRISWSFLHYSTSKENLNSRHTLFYCALLYWTLQVLWFTKWKFVASLWPSVSVPFPQHLLFLYLCHILGILVIFHFYYCICDQWFLGKYERKSAANFITLRNWHSHPNLSNHHPAQSATINTEKKPHHHHYQLKDYNLLMAQMTTFFSNNIFLN